ncbi:MAG: Signaling protein ykoW [Acidimicrobiales bacterium]|nr:Signaling protein ykoW [Acidimicrobiales bacterium]
MAPSGAEGVSDDIRTPLGDGPGPRVSPRGHPRDEPSAPLAIKPLASFGLPPASPAPRPSPPDPGSSPEASAPVAPEPYGRVAALPPASRSVVAALPRPDPPMVAAELAHPEPPAAGQAPTVDPFAALRTAEHDPSRPRVPPIVWRAYLGAGAVAVLVLLAGLLGSRSMVLFDLVTFAPVLAIAIGCHLHRPSARRPWVLLAVAQGLFGVAAVLSHTVAKVGYDHLPQRLTDLVHLGAYVVLVGALLLLIPRRNRERDLPSLIDALIILIGAAFVFWVSLMSTVVHDPALTLVPRVTALAYPAMDLLLLGAIARLAVDRGRRPEALHLCVGAFVLLFVTDCVDRYVVLQGSGHLLAVRQAGWMGVAVLLGAAALHPSMRDISEPSPSPDARLSFLRLALLAAASLLAPGVQLMAAAGDRSVPVMTLTLTTVALLLLVVARMSVTVKVHERAEARERSLREAGASLAAAATIETTYEAIMTSAVEMAGPVRMRLLVVDDDDFRVVATNGERALLGQRVTRALLGRERCEALALGRVVQQRADRFLAAHLDLGGARPSVVTLPLAVQDRVAGALVLASKTELDRPVVDGLTALAFQLALALDAAALAEDLHRQNSDDRFRSLVQHASDVVTVIDHSAIVTFQSSSGERVFGSPPESWIGRSVLEHIHPDDIPGFAALLSADSSTPSRPGHFEWRWSRADGSWIYAESRWTDLRHDPNVSGIVLNTRDITERKAFEAQLSHQAFHDGITGLANRALFRDRVEHALSRQDRMEHPISVLFVDLDDFKTVNDSLGHAAGDELLRLVASRLGDFLRSSDTAARLGGDEFAVLLEEGGEESAVEVAQRMLQGFADPFYLDGRELFVHASIGIANSNRGASSAESADALLRDADAAMYMAKSLGKDRFELFESSMHDNVLRRLELKAEMERGSEDGEFILHYQPIVELFSGRLAGLEALVRWMHPRLGLVSPDSFIPLAEETGLIIPIGRWVLQEACRRLPQIHASYPSVPPVTMAINLSGKQVQHPDIVEDVRQALADSGVDPSCITLEITESVMMDDTDFAVQRLTELKALGVRLAVDDFGTGYSSLNSLRNFPVDILKVDRSFTEKLGSSPKDWAVVNTILDLAKILDLKPVAEGIEDLEQLDQLSIAGCTFGQGFLLARPLDDAGLDEFLADRLAAAAAGPPVSSDSTP